MKRICICLYLERIIYYLFSDFLVSIFCELVYVLFIRDLLEFGVDIVVFRVFGVSDI